MTNPRPLALGALLLTFGCAEIAPAISVDQTRTFQQAVERARRAGAGDEYSPAGSKLRDAESDFYYAQHLPSDPARARAMAAKAREEADAALRLIQSGDAELALSQP